LSVIGGAIESRPQAAPRTSGLTRRGLAWLQVARRPRWAASLWLCLAVAIAVPALLPLVGEMAAESALAGTLAAGRGLIVERNAADLAAFDSFLRGADAAVTADMGARLLPVTDYVSVVPFPVVPAGAGNTVAAGGPAVTPSYLDHLAAHVTVVAGELPPEGLGGGEAPVTMAQSGADQLGLRLSDRFCLRFTAGGGPPGWCARLVGLWQPLDAGDPYWGSTAPQRRLTMGRYDFFKLLGLRPPGAAVSGLRYRANPTLIGAGQATAVAAQVRRLSSRLTRSGLRVQAPVVGDLQRFDAAQRQVTTVSHLVAAATALLGLLVVALVCTRFLDGQVPDLTVLRARGWSRRHVGQLAFAGPGMLSLAALPAGLAACLAVAALVSVLPSGISVAPLRPGDLGGPAAAVGVSAVALVGVLAALAAWVVRRHVEPPADPLPRRPRPAAWDGPLAITLVVAGTVAMALPRLPGYGALQSALPPSARDLLPVVPALGLALLAAAAAGRWPLRTFVWRPGAGVPRLLATRQLERRPRQHSALLLVLILAAATGTYTAIALGEAAAGRLAPLPAVRAGLEAGLVAGCLGTLLLALTALAFHFRWVVQRRLSDYGGLFAHGLPVGDVARSLAAEQAATVGSGLVLGGLLGVALVLTALPAATTVVAAAVGAVSYLLLLGAGLLGVASLSRRLPAWVNPLSVQRLP
jgi:hypothetical protein